MGVWVVAPSHCQLPVPQPRGSGGSHGAVPPALPCLRYLRDCIFDFQPEAKQLVT